METKEKDVILSLSLSFPWLGLKIQVGICQENDDGSTTNMPEISQVTPGSVADHCGQLQIGRRLLFNPSCGAHRSLSLGDQVLEWNGHQLKNLTEQEVYRIIAENSMQTPDIHLIVKRSIRWAERFFFVDSLLFFFPLSLARARAQTTGFAIYSLSPERFHSPKNLLSCVVLKNYDDDD